VYPVTQFFFTPTYKDNQGLRSTTGRGGVSGGKAGGGLTRKLELGTTEGAVHACINHRKSFYMVTILLDCRDERSYPVEKASYGCI